MLCRDFVEQQYVNLKKSNPDFPILIRECSGVQARIWARYGESAQPSLPDHRGPKLQCTKAEAVLVAVVFQSWLQGPTWNLQNHPSSSITVNDLMMCWRLFVVWFFLCRFWEGEKCFRGQHVSWPSGLNSSDTGSAQTLNTPLFCTWFSPASLCM